jgi:hypothetical protein
MNKIFSSLTIGAVLTALSGVGFGQSSLGGQSLQGAWNVTVSFDGVPQPICTAPSLNTGDGGVIAGGCSLAESPGYGQWVRVGNGEFAITFVGSTYDAGGAINGSYKVRAKVKVSNNVQAFSGPFRTDVFDLNGNVVFTTPGTVAATRIVIELL